MVAVGDSKTMGYPYSLATYAYRNELATNLLALPGVDSADFVGALAVNAMTMEQAVVNLPAFISSVADKPNFVLFSVGSADIPHVNVEVTEAAWTANLGTALDLMHAAWPDAQILVMRPLWIFYAANSDVMDDDWIPSVLATRGAFAAVGPDERTFLDMSNTIDGLHPLPAGYSLTAAEWQTVMGY